MPSRGATPGRKKMQRWRAHQPKCGLTGKVRFRDQTEAKAVLTNSRRSDSERRRECRTYECMYCNGWHLTSVGLGTADGNDAVR